MNNNPEKLQCLNYPMDASKMTNDTEKKVQPSVIKEGQAEILVYETKNVFYNPVQEFNRDLRYASGV